MPRTPLYSIALLASVLTAGILSAACGGGNDHGAPAAETQTKTPVQAASQPVTVTGCLRAGEATNTFVLTASEAGRAQQAGPATYQLHAPENVDMQSHVGRQVEVRGIVRSAQELASRSTSVPAGERATGTSGTPTVQTTTEVEIRELDVNTVRTLAENCAG